MSGRDHFHILDPLAALLGRLDFALVLMKERDGVDQGQVFLVVPTRARALVEEGQPLGVGVDHGQGFEKALGISVQGADGLGLFTGQQALQRPGAARCRDLDASGLVPDSRPRSTPGSGSTVLRRCRSPWWSTAGITGPSTRYSSVTSFPVGGVLSSGRDGQLALRTEAASGHSWPAGPPSSSAMPRILCLRSCSPR